MFPIVGLSPKQEDGRRGSAVHLILTSGDTYVYTASYCFASSSFVAALQRQPRIWNRPSILGLPDGRTSVPV